MELNKTLEFQLFEATMIILNAVRDFADGLSRGFALFFTERRDDTVRDTLPNRTPTRR